ncbi:unnamed protein product [Protopolystoma xenopodis]|uniref:Mic1 domain-containing protein n=1 Tax=Protopolystoma xenopodis TaxID=117903 RepID=A0A3S5AH15_9PLAT|nr:unnamed protein product [Protopolystoma xenopodis]
MFLSCKYFYLHRPSLILKFLEGSQMAQLSLYLEALIQSDLANADHFTLLLICYTRLSDEKRIDAFIESAAARLPATDVRSTALSCPTETSDVSANVHVSDSAPTKLNLDVSSLLRVLRRAGYPKHALQLATQAARSIDCVRILVEDLDDGAGLLACIDRLPFNEVKHEKGTSIFNLIKHLYFALLVDTECKTQNTFFLY